MDFEIIGIISHPKFFAKGSGIEATKYHQLRIVDESGDDYLYPESFFLAISLQERIAEQVMQAA